MKEELKINESTEDMIRSLVSVQESQAKMIKELVESTTAIRDTMMTNLRFELHDSMMNCIIRNYATPEEYDRITEKMGNYTSLKGNHGLQVLYEQKFRNLPIHN